MTAKPLILLSNDDGVHAEGLHCLAEAMASLGKVVIVAPHMERSAFSHALTISTPLRIQKLDSKPYSEEIFEVTGTPVDCVKIALDKLLPRAPDLVMSGVNRGGNLGTDILYSGTVGAAMEALINGCRAMAISCHGPLTSPLDYRGAARIAGLLAATPERWFGAQTRWMLNVNVPSGDIRSVKGIRTAIPGKRMYDDSYWQKTDPRGVDYFWLGADSQSYADIDGSDCQLVGNGFASVSALQASFVSGEGLEHIASGLHSVFDSLLAE